MILKNKKAKVKCFKCEKIINDKVVRLCFNTNEINSYEKICIHSFISIVKCLSNGCSSWLSSDKEDVISMCDVCNQPNCIKCQQRHFPVDCGKNVSQRDYQEELRSAGAVPTNPGVRHSQVHQKAAHLIESSVIKAKEKIIYDFRNLVCDLDLSVDTVKLTFNPYNKREYLDYQKILIENVENSLNVNLKEKTMTSVNSLLKIGIEKLTKIYCELLASRPNPHINEKTTTGCQNAVLHIYPEFSIIMNKKIADVTDLIPKIPPHLLTMEKCLSTLNSIDNRFSSYVGSRMHLNETGYAGGYNAATRQPIISSSSSSLTARYPEMELMIPRFSTVIMTDFKYSPGFKFSLSPNSVRILAHNWSSTNCPVRSKARLIGRPLLAFSVILAGTGYAVVVTNFRYTRHAVAVLLGCYGLMYVMERSRWDSGEKMLSLKDQFITHSKFKMETIIVISAATTDCFCTVTAIDYQLIWQIQLTTPDTLSVNRKR